MDQRDFAVLACLKQNRVRLFPPCRYVLVGHFNVVQGTLVLMSEWKAKLPAYL
jgi:hypothetical protein